MLILAVHRQFLCLFSSVGVAWDNGPLLAFFFFHFTLATPRTKDNFRASTTKTENGGGLHYLNSNFFKIFFLGIGLKMSIDPKKSGTNLW